MKKTDKTTEVKKVIDKKVETLKKVSKPVDNIPVVTQREFNARKIAFYTILGSVFVAVGILTFFAKQRPYFAIDLTITKEVQEFNAVWFESLMNFLTFVGNPLSSAILLIFTTAIFFLKKRKKEAVMVLISTIGATLISITMKRFVHRVRPNPKLIHQVTRYLKPDSFPSGHVLFYVGFFGFLLYLTFTLPANNRYRIVLLAIFTFMVSFIGTSRIYLGAHWFSDVMGAYLVGFVWLSIVIFLYNKWQPKVKPS